MEKKNIIVIYGRVSSAAQSLELQLSAARRYLESEGLTGKEDFVFELSDHDVSATKLKMNERPKLMELIRLIKEGKVKMIIVYKRDRLARNFFELVDITKIFIKYKVKVVYTASNEAPFRNQLTFEAFYGIFGQMEGENIRTRTNDARKQFPPSLLGYKRLKENEQVHYVINQEKQAPIVSLFNEFSDVKDEEQFIELLISKRKGINNPEKILRILTNPFYAAHYESKSGLQRLPHVEPMICLDLYSKVNSQIDQFIAFYAEKLKESSNLFTIAPLCGFCGTEMKLRKENVLDAGYYVCRATHRRLTITVEELNHSMKQIVLDHAKSISAELAHKTISKHIVSTKKRLEHEQKIATSEYLEASLQLCTLERIGKSTVLSKYLDIIQLSKNKYNEIDQDLISLHLLNNELKNINTILSREEIEFSQQDIQRLMELLVNSVVVHDAYVKVNLFLSNFVKETNVS